MTATAPLPSALHAILGGLERAYKKEGAGSATVPSLDLWANLLRALDPAAIGRGTIDRGTIDRGELPAILRLSKRAVRSRLSTAVRRGWVEELKTERSGGLFRLTSLGSEMAVRWKGLEPSAEDRWKTRVGAEVSNQLRMSLEHLVAAFPLEHPHYPASYGLADASIRGGNGGGSGGESGVDWKPVPRIGSDTVSNLPLSALVSQALVAFAMQYEELSPVAFSLSASVIRQIPAEGRRLQELGRSPGVAALIRHGFVDATGPSGREIASLTARGLDVQRRYEPRIQIVETSWQRQFGKDRVAALVGALQEAEVRQGSGEPG